MTQSGTRDGQRNRTQSTTLQIGTTKGLFRLTYSDGDVGLEGPFCDGWSINHVLGVGDLHLAAGGSGFTGAGIWRSEDAGATWTLVKLSDGELDVWLREDPSAAQIMGREAAPPAPLSGRVDAIWSLGRAGARLLAGAKPATLLSSEDAGQSWSVVDSLTDHPSASDWQPGAAGLTLHTLVSDPARPDHLWLGISAAGVFASEDGGATWERRNRLSNAESCADHPHPAAPRDGETGHCVHNMVRAAGVSDLLYQQNHHGTYRSRDGGRSWEDITEGLPSTFGFPIAVHPDDPLTLWTVPLNGDSQGRYPPEAEAAVWRSRDGGERWTACRRGLPQAHCYFTVLRQAMCVDAQAGVYFGTNSGSIFASFDEGDSWQELAQHLPTVLCVEAVMQT